MYPTRTFISLLPSGMTSSRVADECRSAALGFVSGAKSWDKRRLAEWLEESYRPLAIGMPAQGEAVIIDRPLRHLVSMTFRPKVDAVRIREIVAAAREAILAILRTLTDQASVADFGAFAIRSGLVHRCIDDNGDPAWAPRASGRMKLADRVLSLFAADCLARPWEYESLLFVCGDCDGVQLMAHASCCSRHSGVMLRGAQVTGRGRSAA